MGYKIDYGATDTYTNGASNCMIHYRGDEYDRSLAKSKIVFSNGISGVINEGWVLNASQQFAKEVYGNGLPFLIYPGGGYYYVRDWMFHFSCKFSSSVATQNGVIFTSFLNDAVDFDNGYHYTYPTSYKRPTISITVENNNLCFHLYQNFDSTDSTNNVDEFPGLSIPIVFDSWQDVDIKYYANNDKIEFSSFGMRQYVIRTAFTTNGFNGYVTFGGYNGGAFDTNTPQMSVTIKDFTLNRTITGEYKITPPLWYPDTIFLLSCDMLPPLDNGISASIITGTSPILDTSNQLFDYPTYSFTGSQYCQADNVYISYDKRKTYRVDFWFKATQTTSKAVIFYVNSGATAHSMECFIYNNLLCFAGAGTTVMSTAFTDTASWHCASIYCLGTDSNGRASNLSMYLDGSLVANAGDILPAFESFTVGNFYIGKDDSGNYFKGNLSNLRIEAPENGTPYSDSDFTVPTKAYDPTDYF